MIVVIAHPDDEVLWLSAALPFATAILAALFETPSEFSAHSETRMNASR